MLNELLDVLSECMAKLERGPWFLMSNLQPDYVNQSSFPVDWIYSSSFNY